MGTSLLIVAGAFAVLLLTSLIKNVNWSAKAKHVLTMTVSLFVGLGTAMIQTGGVEQLADNPDGVIGVIGVIYLSSQVVFQFIMKGSKAESFLAEKDLV